jgi:hypothetical protein
VEALESKDKAIIPDDIGFVTAEGVTYPIPPEQRADEQVQALVFKWMGDGVLSIVPRRDKALQRCKDGRRTKDSKDMPWIVTTKCADKKIANKVISNIKVAELPPSLSPKTRGSIRKWRPDNNGYTRKRRNASTMGARRRREWRRAGRRLHQTTVTSNKAARGSPPRMANNVWLKC